ncbi:MAG: cupin domain-containing protein [Alphaproteobacteria bacterium]|tara:strand:+ start:725 stop:1180 length:456 start_codon:yes stop_codon:yes gene_type:complete
MAENKSLDPMTVEASLTTIYPKKFKAMCIGREKRKIGDALGLNKFGVNLVTLKPGAASSQRHWHSHSDEFVYILEGEVTMISDAGEEILGPGMTAGFPANNGDGHHLVNKSGADVLYLEVGDRPPKDDADYPDVDMLVRDGKLVHKDGTPY